MNNITKFNSIVDAVNAHAKKMLDDGLTGGNDLSSLSISETIQAITDAYAVQLIPDEAEEIIEENDGNPSSIGDQLYYLLDVVERKAIEENPLSVLAVDVDIAVDTDLLDKVVGDLQSNVSVTGNRFAGTLLYVDDYLGFSTTEGQYKGNYLVFHVSVGEVTGAVLKVKTANEEVTLDPDGIMILQVLNKHAPIKVIASKEGYADVVKVYHLDDLILEAPPATD